METGFNQLARFDQYIGQNNEAGHVPSLKGVACPIGTNPVTSVRSPYGDLVRLSAASIDSAVRFLLKNRESTPEGLPACIQPVAGSGTANGDQMARNQQSNGYYLYDQYGRRISQT